MKILTLSLLLCLLIFNMAISQFKNPHNEEPSQVVKDVMLQYGIEQGELKIIDKGFWKFESETSAVVAFETSERASSTLDWGETAAYGQVLRNDDFHYIHIFHMKDLKKNQTYHLKFSAKKYSDSQQIETQDIQIKTKEIADAVRIPDDFTGNPPYILDQTNTYYILTSDIDADSTAIIFTGEGSTLDLNGHTVVYNEIPLKIPTDQWTPHRNGSSFGIKMRNAGPNMRIFNGTIVQGKGNDTSSYVSLGFNPIYVSGAENLEIAGLRIQYTGVQITGIYCHWPREGYTIHHNIVLDSGKYIINRHQQVSAIKMNSPGRGKLYNNLILRARQTALALGTKSEAYNNEIHIDSYSINSFGIGAKDTSKVYDNKIFGCGDNTCAIATTGNTTDTEIFGNYIWLQAHSLEDYLPWLNPKEMESATTSTMSGIRVTWGGLRINYHDNIILVTSREGGIVRASWLYSENSTAEIKCENNLFIALAEDDSSAQWGAIGGVGNHSHNDAPPITFKKNTIVSNFTNFSMKDTYGYSMNYLFINNTFVRTGNFDGYFTINSHEGYDSKGAIFIDSKFEGGADYDKIYMSQYSEDEFTVKWTLHIIAPNNTNITIRDRNNNIIDAFKIDGSDKIDRVLTQYKQVQNNKEFVSPYYITAEYLGNIENKQIDIDTIKTIKFFEESAVDEEIIDKNTYISPNPATDYIEISLDRWAPLSKWSPPVSAIKIYNVLGNVVLSTGTSFPRKWVSSEQRSSSPGNADEIPDQVGNDSQDIRINVSGLPAGVYFVRVGSRMLKFVKL